MKEIKDPVKEDNRLSVLMAVYIVLYAAAVILAIIAMSSGVGVPLIIAAVVCAVSALVIDIYVRTARSRLNQKLNEQFMVAGIDPRELEKNRRKNRR